MPADNTGHRSHVLGAPLTTLASRIAMLALLAGFTRAHAQTSQDDCKGPSDDCVAIGQWNFSIALGAGIRTNPLKNGQDIPLVVVPQLSYYGKRFFIDNLDLGFTLLDKGSNTISLIATPGYDRVYFFRTDLQNFFIGFPVNGNSNAPAPVVPPNTPGAIKVTPRAPSVTYLGGPEWTFQFARITGQLDLLHDITGQNSGDEIRAALGVPLVKAKGAIEANVGFTWKSAAIVNYYYGVPPIYRGSSAFDPFIKLGYTLPIARKWRINAFAEYEWLGSAIADSPIVAAHGVATVFAGTVYAF